MLKKNYMNKKKIAFISGSSKGRGFEIAKKLINENYFVIINSNNKKELKRKSQKFKYMSYIKGDITNANDVKNIFLEIKSKYRYLDLLVCNYGNSKFDENHLDLQNALNKNLLPAFFCIKYSQKLLRKNKSKIICISSICGIESVDGAPMGYSVAKSALNTLVKIYSKLLSKNNISINSIAPGNLYFKGSLWEKKLKQNKIKTKNYIKNNVPINKFGKIEDVFTIIKSILYNKTNFISGSIFITDGSQTKKF